MQFLILLGTILNLLRAIPEVIAVVKFIIELIRSGRKDLRVQRMRRLRDILKQATASKDMRTMGASLETLKAELEKEIAEELT